MVQKGQFLERPTLIPVGPIVLEGLSHRGTRSPPLLIVPPTPGEGGSMDHVVAAEAAWAAATRAFPTLRFNFAGVGGSQGARGSGAALIPDVEEALRLLLENTGAPACVAVSIGGSARTLAEVARRSRQIVGLCFVSPVEITPEELRDLRLPLRVIVGALDLRQPRVALASAVAEAGGRVEIVDDADQTFVKNLAQVGRSIAEFLMTLEGR
ncbi:MAG: alpha/beta hydrolase [Myxococcaceae bacterium]|nr:alpha/beta hydrolase [Myxococcaceae bacterium]